MVVAGRFESHENGDYKDYSTVLNIIPACSVIIRTMSIVPTD